MTAIELILATTRTAAVLVAPPGTKYCLAAPVDWQLTEWDGSPVATGRATQAPVFVEDLVPDTRYRFRCALGMLEFRTACCAGLIEAGDHGADPALQDNAMALSRAIEAVPHGGTLRLAPGTYTTRPIFLRPDMTLYLPAGAELAAPAGFDGWPVLQPLDAGGRVVSTWEGVPERSFAAIITAIAADNVNITGRGTIDGGGDRGDWWDWPKETRNGARRPRTVHLAHCRSATLSGLTIRNSPSWTVHPYRCDGFRAVALTIENRPDSPNTDGLNPESCIDVILTGVDFSVGDDCIAIKAGKRLPGQLSHLAPTRHLTVAHCRMRRGHGAVVLGSEMSGDITDVEIHACEFHGTDRGLRLKTRRGRGGRIARVRMSDVTMDQVATPFAANAYYFCDSDGHSDWVQSRQPAEVTDTTPVIEDIALGRVTARDVSVAAAALLGLPESPIRRVTLDDFAVTYDPKAVPGVPLMAEGVGAVRHGGVLAEHAEVTGTVRHHDGGTGQSAEPETFFETYLHTYQPYKGGAWCYEDGCIYRGLELLHRATGEVRWINHLVRLIDRQIAVDGSLVGYDADQYNIDNILPGRALLYLHEVTGEARYLDAAGRLASQLQRHPRTHSGIYWHKLRYPWQVWLDGLYMGVPFQIAYGLRTSQPSLVSDSLAQVAIALEATEVPETGLYAHAVDEARTQAWADPRTGRSPAHWARSLGWLAMALVDIAELVEPADFAPIRSRTARFLDDIARLRRPGSFWLQVIDRPDLPGNYLESSASAMFVYALQRGQALGLWPGPADGLAVQLMATFLQPKAEGGLEMVEICEVAGLGMFQDRFRDGSAEYYLTEARVRNDAKGVGPLMMARAAALRRT